MATAAERRTFASIEEAIEDGRNGKFVGDRENERQLRAKREKLGHRLHHQDLEFEPDAEA